MCAADFTQDGIMYSTSINNTAWVISAKSVAGSVTLPADVTYNGKSYVVTTIASEDFSDNEYIEGILVQGQNLVEIQDEAFAYCTKLKMCKVPMSLKKLGNRVFYGSGLTSINMPPVTTMGTGAFEDCTSLSSAVLLPGGIRELPSNTFSYTGITSLVISEDVVSLANRSIQGCSKLTSVKLPSTLERIGDNVFVSCPNISEINFPSNLKSIGEFSFYDTKLKSVVLPEGFTTLKKYAFYKNNTLESLVLPSTLTALADNNFSYYKKLKVAYFNANTCITKARSNFSFGDVTGDYIIDVADLNKVINIILGLWLGRETCQVRIIISCASHKNMLKTKKSRFFLAGMQK